MPEVVKTTKQISVLNGVNVDQLVSTVDAIKQNPSLAKFRFRAENVWVDGGHSRTTIQSFYGAGKEDSSRAKPFVLDGDEPPILLGANRGPNAVEAVLHALGSCLSVGFVYNAAARTIKVERLEISFEGDIDLHRFLGLSGLRPGYQNIRVTCRVKANAPEEAVTELWNYVVKTSPVFDIIGNPVPISTRLEFT